MEAFLEDEEKIAAIRERAKAEAERRAEEWGLDEQLNHNRVWSVGVDGPRSGRRGLGSGDRYSCSMSDFSAARMVSVVSATTASRNSGSDAWGRRVHPVP